MTNSLLIAAIFCAAGIATLISVVVGVHTKEKELYIVTEEPIMSDQKPSIVGVFDTHLAAQTTIANIIGKHKGRIFAIETRILNKEYDTSL
jgi:hypothetical protein